jgi:hypothetical protein
MRQFTRSRSMDAAVDALMWCVNMVFSNVVSIPACFRVTLRSPYGTIRVGCYARVSMESKMLNLEHRSRPYHDGQTPDGVRSESETRVRTLALTCRNTKESGSSTSASFDHGTTTEAPRRVQSHALVMSGIGPLGTQPKAVETLSSAPALRENSRMIFSKLS